MNKYREGLSSVLGLPDYRWTLERYHAAIAAGVLDEYDKVELLFGKLVPMSPVGIIHGKTVKIMNRLFTKSFPEEKYTIGIQDPVTLNDDSEPEPDVFIAKGPIESYNTHPYPEDLLLVVEVADSTLKNDRTAKKFSYAVAGIIEYWIVNVYERQIERFTEPIAEEGTYGKMEIFKQGQSFSCPGLGDFNVDDLLVKNA